MKETHKEITAAVPQLPITLQQLLKYELLVGSGGEAKEVILGGRVSVNGIVETRRGKKIVSGDIVEFEGVRVRVTQGDQGGLS